MKIKIVESLDKYNNNLNARLLKGKITKPERAIVMTPAVFCKVFSPERIRLLQRIFRNNVKNIYQLAKELDKPYEVVFRNIKYLEGIGIVKIDKRNKKKIPHLSNSFSIDMFSKEAVA